MNAEEILGDYVYLCDGDNPESYDNSFDEKRALLKTQILNAINFQQNNEYLVKKITGTWSSIRCPNCKHTWQNCLCSESMIRSALEAND